MILLIGLRRSKQLAPFHRLSVIFLQIVLTRSKASLKMCHTYAAAGQISDISALFEGTLDEYEEKVPPNPSLAVE